MEGEKPREAHTSSVYIGASLTIPERRLSRIATSDKNICSTCTPCFVAGKAYLTSMCKNNMKSNQAAGYTFPSRSRCRRHSERHRQRPSPKTRKRRRTRKQRRSISGFAQAKIQTSTSWITLTRRFSGAVRRPLELKVSAIEADHID
jgi:hypothetical protein